MTFDSAQTATTKNIPAPTRRPETSAPAATAGAPSVAAPQPANDKISLSTESQEPSSAQTPSVNLASWDAPGGESAGAPAPAQASTDISALGTGTLRKGARGEEVAALQRMLNEKTGGNLEVDGKFGNKTLEALQKFQKSQGLDSDGIVGKNTRAAFAGPTGNDATGDAATPPAAGAEQAGTDAATAAGAEQAGTNAATPPAEAAKGETEVAGAEQVKAPEAGQEAAKTSAVPGTEDTSWTEDLPKGLKPHAQAFIDAGKKYGVDPRFLAAISMQETGGGTSYSMRKRNNAMGIMKGSQHRSFDSVAASIDSQAKSLTRPGGLYTGDNSIAEIGGTYAPIGAKNDPGKLNRHWVPNITKNFKTLGGDATGRVKGFDTTS